MNERGDIIGLVLAGGLSRRMGGADKVFASLGGRPLLAWTIEAARAQCDALLLSGDGDSARFAAFGLPVIADAVPGHAGPLAGILAGLDHVADHFPRARYLLSLPADCPFLPPDLGERLRAAVDAGASLACAASSGRRHPVVALWPIALRMALRRALTQRDERGVGQFQASRGAAAVEWPNQPYDPFFNINQPEDLEAARRLLQLRSARGD